MGNEIGGAQQSHQCNERSGNNNGKIETNNNLIHLSKNNHCDLIFRFGGTSGHWKVFIYDINRKYGSKMHSILYSSSSSVNQYLSINLSEFK